MSKRIDYIIDDIKEQYLENDNNIPWIISVPLKWDELNN